MENSKVSVVITNWNGINFLPDCLFSLKKQSYKNFELVLADNGSTDNSVEFFKSNFPEAKIVRLEKNYGFPRIANEGIKVSEGKYVILLNNDTKADKNFIKELVSSLNKHPDCAGCTSKIIDFFDHNILRAAGDVMNTIGQAFPRGFLEKVSKYNNPEEVFIITGGASIYRKDVFKKIGFFDEDYFLYGEDSDWCLRAQLMGYKFWYEPKAIVYHHCGASSKRLSKIVEYFLFRNMTITILKNFPIKIFFRKWRFITIPLVHLNTIFYMSFNGCFKEAILADLWIIFHFFQIMKKRFFVQSNIKASVNYIDNWMQPKKLRFYGLLK